MNAVGIDISKGKSTVAIMQPVAFCSRHPCWRLSCDCANILFAPLGVVVVSLFGISHNGQELKELVRKYA